MRPDYEVEEVRLVQLRPIADRFMKETTHFLGRVDRVRQDDRDVARFAEFSLLRGLPEVLEKYAFEEFVLRHGRSMPGRLVAHSLRAKGV